MPELKFKTEAEFVEFYMAHNINIDESKLVELNTQQAMIPINNQSSDSSTNNIISEKLASWLKRSSMDLSKETLAKLTREELAGYLMREAKMKPRRSTKRRVVVSFSYLKWEVLFYILFGLGVLIFAWNY